MIKGSREWYQMVIETIHAIYQEELGRNADPSGLSTFIYAAIHAFYTDVEIRRDVRLSDEWKEKHPPTPPPPVIRQFSFNELANVRGALNIKMNAPFGLRPNQDDNTASTNGGWNYSEDMQSHIIAEYKLRGYTHGPVGPFIDPGYHSIWPGVDFRNENERVQVENWLIRCNKAGLITPVFVSPDGWDVDRLRTLDFIFKTPLWQELCQFVVNGFEQQGSKYGWSNKRYVETALYLRETFPNAKIVALHTISKIEAPVGDGDDTSKPGMSNADCWKRIALAGFNLWFYQDDMWGGKDQNIDPTNPDGKTDLEHFVSLWDRNDKNSFVRRFGPEGIWDSDIIPIPGEFGSFGLVWNNEPESRYRTIGRRCINVGARGSFDGC